MNRRYETKLPADYQECFTVDCTSGKLGIGINLAALVIAAAAVAAAWFLIRPRNFFAEYSLVRNGVWLAALLLYIVLHELTHGAVYKLETGRKLRFGLTLTAAYCGVPDIYVYRRTALHALLAPFILFLPVFLLPALLLADPWNRFYAALLLALHLSGCAGDLYDTFLFLTRLRGDDILMQDTGPKQTFYAKRNDGPHPAALTAEE